MLLPSWQKKETTPLGIQISKHLSTCFDRECSTYYQPLKSSQLVFLGDNTTYEIHGQGMVTIRLLNGIEKQTPKNLHVLTLKNKLFSTKQFDKVAREMYIKQGQYTLINKSRDIIAK